MALLRADLGSTAGLGVDVAVSQPCRHPGWPAYRCLLLQGATLPAVNRLADVKERLFETAPFHTVLGLSEVAARSSGGCRRALAVRPCSLRNSIVGNLLCQSLVPRDFNSMDLASSVAFPLTSNLLYRQLSSADRALIECDADLIVAPGGTLLVEAGTPLQSVFFPVAGMISIERHDGIEVALIGSEGMLGLSAIAEETLFPFRAIVRGRSGQFLRLPVASVRTAADRSPSFNLMLSQYFLVIAVQMSEAISANALYGVQARIARWLLLRHDRVAGDEIRIQHDEIAASLGARRASVTDCLHLIEGESYIRCRRGRIQIRNREPLERMVSGCYGAAEEQYRKLFGAFGKSEIKPEAGGDGAFGNSALSSAPLPVRVSNNNLT